MIHVDRSTTPIPPSLLSKTAELEREKITRMLSGSEEHLSQTRFRFYEGLWQDAKAALLKLFHNKCAYCESRFSANLGSERVDHFRPRDGVQEADGTRAHHYYAWLAYEWDNLLIACPACIVSRKQEGRIVGKGDRFPVEGPRARLLAHVKECRETEKYLLIDPCFDRPEEHLQFYPDGGCLPRSPRGEVTIQLLDLNRLELLEARRRTWHEVDDMVALLARPEPELLENQYRPLGRLAQLLSGDQPYTAVAREAFRTHADRLRKHEIALGPELAAWLPPEPQQQTSVLGLESVKAQVQGAIYGVRRRVKGASKVAARLAEPTRKYHDRAVLPPRAHDCLRRITIRNFKAIDEVDFELPPPASGDRGPCLMLLGENATGKSSVLEAVALALMGTEQIARLKCGADEFIHRPLEDWDAPLETLEPAEIEIGFDDGPPVRLVIDPVTGNFEGEAKPSTVVLGYGPRRFFSDRKRRVRRARHAADRVRTLFDPLAIIDNPTSWLMNTTQARFDAAVRALRDLLLMPEEGLVTRPPEGERREGDIMLQVQGDPEPLRRLSEGYKTTVATGVDVMREMLEYWPDLESARGVVLIDELETHLHPRWKMRIVERLRGAMPRVQFIATTHDPLCLRGLDDGEAQVLRRDADRRIEQVTDLPSVRGLSVEQLLTSEFFGLYSTEDPRLEEQMARYVTLAAKPEQERSEDESAELARHREELKKTVTLGATPAAQLVQDAVSELLVQQRQAPAAERPVLKKAAVSRVLELWNSAGPAQEK